jgi:hypothetical protein
MLSAFCKAAKLKNWLSRPDCPQFLKECKVVFDKALNKPSLTISDDPNIPGSAYASPPASLWSILSDHRIALRAHHKFNNVVFSQSSTHQGNSLILFYPNGDRSLSPVPASIEHIICRQSKEVIYAVRRQEPAALETCDPFQFYPHFPATVYSPTLSPCVEVVHPEWVFSHYARWKLDPNRVVILTLSQASPIISFLP